jgi:type IV pilus assembly protein PilV
MKQQTGFSMLEVLIAIVILSFGLLGVAGLQLVSLASNHSAQVRTTATSLAYDIADRMRANMAAVSAGNYNGISGADNQCQATHYDDIHATPANCTAAELAADDIYDWGQSIAGLLPNGTGAVCIDSTPNTAACDGNGVSYAVRVSWDDKPKNAAPVSKSVVMEFQP